MFAEADEALFDKMKPKTESAKTGEVLARLKHFVITLLAITTPQLLE